MKKKQNINIRVWLLVGLCMLSILIMGCGKKPDPNQDIVHVYFVSNSETKVEVHDRVMESTDFKDRLDELLTALSVPPEKLEYKAPLNMGFEILDVMAEDGKVMLNMSSTYAELAPVTEILVRAAIVRTLTQLEQISYVGISVDGNQFFDSMGNLVGWMNAEQFIDNDGNEINTYELVKVKLYFANEMGDSLVVAFREKHYSTNTPIERFVVDELIAGPSGKVAGLYPTINPATKVINVMTKDGICYVNLDDSFLSVVNNVAVETAVYSIVNSLVELSNVNKVQILINGEVPSALNNTYYERNLDIVTKLE